ncbi:MAG: CBS domain-containing protein [Gemmatimonadetes bacterium]|nr:CBS domain-containing protein [Gemmatimonadota bacterium]MYB98777.1 CBS domain-containing protein [Gemmatimonadota bacterium]MYH52863.1 CBS domain-containing protein [Gemmatimonadota bacterium]MYK65157.1 CBS domain-containing protein [Gemmatimonadota bacterium]
MKLQKLLPRPPILTSSGSDVWEFLCSHVSGLDPDHRLRLSVSRVVHGGGVPRLGSLASRVDLLDLGGEGLEPGLILCLDEVGMGQEGGRFTRASWVTWGLPRPSVNLFLAPMLARVSAGMHESDAHAIQEIVASNTFLKRKIRTDITVEDVLTPLSYRIYPDSPLGEIQQLMMRRGVAALPVVGANHELLGIITIADVLTHTLPGHESGNASARTVPVARDLMTRSVLCVSEDESLLVASRSMIARGVSMLPVVREGEIIGFLTRGTVMRAFAEAIVI